MRKPFYCLWIFLIIIQEFAQYGQTQDVAPLSMDQAYLNIVNKNYLYSITVTHNLEICEKCDFEILADSVAENASKTVIVNTKYTHDFKIFVQPLNSPLSCGVTSYTFSDGGTYSLEISRTGNNQSSCSIESLDEPNTFLYYWLPLIIGAIVILIFILFTQIWHRMARSPRLSRFVLGSDQQELIPIDFTVSLS
jgi:hypothetical protein